MVIINTIEDLRDYALKLAADAQPKVAEPEEPESIKKIKAILAKYSFNDHREPLTKLVSILVDTELKLPDSGEGFIKYTVIVPLEHRGGHNYPLNRPFFLASLDEKGRPHLGIQEDGNRGNHHYGNWRYATEDEVNAFFALASTNSRLQSALSSLVSSL